MKNLPIILVTAALAFGADQLTKAYIIATLPVGDSFWLLPGILRISYVRNPGGAFSLLAHQTWLFLGVGVLAVLLVIWYGSRAADLRLKVALGLILGGAMGNLLDRWRSGQVTDFLDFRIWPVFNLADVAVVVGILTFLALSLTGRENGKIGS